MLKKIKRQYIALYSAKPVVLELKKKNISFGNEDNSYIKLIFETMKFNCITQQIKILYSFR